MGVDVGIFLQFRVSANFYCIVTCASSYPEVLCRNCRNCLSSSNSFVGEGCIVIPILQINRSLQRLSKELKVI